MSPNEQYSLLWRERETRLQRIGALDARLGSVRLAIGASFLLIIAACLYFKISFGWICLPIISFIAVLIYHQRLRSIRAGVERSSNWYRHGIERIDGRFSFGSPGREFQAPHHIYADDLDLFGEDSLYQLTCAARTPLGREMLADWFKAPASLSTIQDRQLSVAELRDHLAFRESMAIDGISASIELHPDKLNAWAMTPNRLDKPFIAWVGPMLALSA